MGIFLSYSFLVLSTITFLLGLTVLSNDIKNVVYRAWFMFCTSVFFWSFGLAMLTLAPNLKAANLFYYIHYFGAIPIPLTFLNFIHHYILRTKEITFDLIFSSFMTLLILYLFVIGDLCAPLSPKWDFTFYTNPARYYWLFVVYFFAAIIYCFYLVIKKYFSLDGTEKTRAGYFLLATMLGYTGGSTAFFLVYDKQVPFFALIPPYGIYLFMFFGKVTSEISRFCNQIAYFRAENAYKIGKKRNSG